MKPCKPYTRAGAPLLGDAREAGRVPARRASGACPSRGRTRALKAQVRVYTEPSTLLTLNLNPKTHSKP